MALDPSIALGVKPLQLENPLNAFAQAQQIQAYQRQNELANRAIEQEDALNRAYAASIDQKTGQIDANRLRQNMATGGIASKLPAAEKSLLDTRKLRGEVDLKELELNIAKKNQGIRDLANYETLADVNKHIEEGLATGKLTPEQAQQAILSLPKTDAEMPKWQIGMLRKTLDAKEQLEQNFTSQDIGGSTRVIATPKYAGGGGAQVVQGSEIKKTATPGELLTNARAQENIKIAKDREARLAAGGDLKPVPVHAQKAITGAASTLGQLNKAIAELEANPNAVGWKGLTPDFALNRLDPEGTVARASLADIGSLKIHERSGAAVTASETPRLRPFIPSISDDYETALTKLKRMRDVQAIEQEVLTGTYNKEQGFKDFTAAEASGAPAAAAGKTVVTLPNGSNMEFPNAKAAAEFKKKAGL